ncbi:MAG: NAD(P)H-hydrate epimerase [Anaerolineales bacterium]
MNDCVPSLSTEQMREVDRFMVEEFQIKLIQMMENAGRTLAALARKRFLGGDPRGSRLILLSGSGGNGGGGLAAGRRLLTWGAEVFVFLTRKPEDMTGVPAHQLSILQNMEGVHIFPPGELRDFPPASLILDALIGYSLKGAPRGHTARLITQANEHPAPILSLDVPSGIHAGTGRIYSPSVRAEATLTLALPKTGLLKEETRPRIGELYLADIGVPSELYRRLDISVGPIFAAEDILRVY